MITPRTEIDDLLYADLTCITHAGKPVFLHVDLLDLLKKFSMPMLILLSSGNLPSVSIKCCFVLEKEELGKCQEIVKQLQDEKQWLEQESKRQVEESERKLENVRAGELQEIRRGKLEALQVLQVSLHVVCVLLSLNYRHQQGGGYVIVRFVIHLFCLPVCEQDY